MVAKLYKRINRALDIACPTKVVSGKAKGNVWYDDELERMGARVSASYKKFNRTGLEHDRVEHRRVSNKYKKEV